jgi:hypothetical protein
VQLIRGSPVTSDKRCGFEHFEFSALSLSKTQNLQLVQYLVIGFSIFCLVKLFAGLSRRPAGSLIFPGISPSRRKIIGR